MRFWCFNLKIIMEDMIEPFPLTWLTFWKIDIVGSICFCNMQSPHVISKIWFHIILLNLSVLYQLDKRNGTSLYSLMWFPTKTFHLCFLIFWMNFQIQFSIEYVKWQKNLAMSEVLKLSICQEKFEIFSSIGNNIKNRKRK